jgi:signal transduction histidine kinase
VISQSAYALIGVTVLMAVLVAVLTFTLLRFSAAARDARRASARHDEPAFLAATLHESLVTLKAQEQAMSARAVASEQLSTQIVESLTAGLLVVDRSGRVEILNPAGRRMLAVTGEPRGADFRQLLADVPPLVAVLDECLLTWRPVLRRALPMPGTAAPAHLGVTVSPLGGLDAPSGVICLFSDLTSIVELEEQLRLKETLARLGELTAGIAHEFRNGLATIHGYSRLIDLDDLPAKYLPYVAGIRDETDALGQVVTNFLSFARPEQVAFAEVDLDAIARRVVDDLRHELPAGTSIRVSGDFALMQGDEVLLRRMFANLIRNAAEAADLTGVVPVITIAGELDERTCRIVINDNGPGIPERSRERIFQPFFTTRSRGTGLGLAIVQKIVVMHSGRITVQNPTIGGASIHLIFPLHPA